MRASKLALSLPTGIAETSAQEGADALIAALDAASLGEVAAQLDAVPGGRRVVWAMPIVRPGMLGWLACRARGLRPLALEDACEAFRHAGLVDVRVSRVAGSLPVVVLSGRKTAA